MSAGPIKFAVQCRTSKLFLSNFTPCRAALEITPVPAIAMQWGSIAEAKQTAASLQPLFGSFDFQPVRVGG